MGTSLTGKNISASYLGLLKTTDNAIIGSTAKRLTDGGGTDSPLYLSTSKLGIGVTPTEALTISSGNIQLSNDNKIQFGTSDVYISGTTSTDNIQLGIQGATKLTLHQTTGLTLAQYGGGTITGTVTQRLGVTSAGQVVEIPIGGGAVDGSGTAGKITKWTDSDTIGDSILSESGSTLSNTGIFRTSGGSAGSPAYAFTDATNTGMFIDGGNLKLSNAGDVGLYVDGNGNTIIDNKLGVGATSLTRGLTVSGAGALGTILASDGTVNTVLWGDASGSNHGGVGTDNNYGFNIYQNGGVAIEIDTSKNATFAGSVSVSDGVQKSKFETNGNDLYLVANSGQTNVSPNFVFKSSVGGGTINEKMRLDSSGRLGINETSLTEKLEVDGAIVWKGALTTSKTSAGVLDRSGDSLRIRAYGATAGSGNLHFRTGGGAAQADTLALTLDSSQNATFAGTINSGAITSTSSVTAVSALLQSASTDAVVDILTLYNPSQASSGVRQRFSNGYGDLAAIKVSQIDNGSLADDGQLEFQTATNTTLSTKLTINNTGNATFAGNVDVYKTTDSQLQIKSLNEDATLIINSGADGVGGANREEGFIKFYQANADFWTLGKRNQGYFSLYDHTAGQYVMQFGDNGAFELTPANNITSITGSVGIGTTSPFGELSIKSASPQIYLETASNGNVQINFNENADQLDVMVNNSSGKIAFGTNSTERMRIASDGVVSVNGAISGYGQFNVSGTDAKPIVALRSTSGRARLGYYESGSGRFYIDSLNGSNGLRFIDGDGSSERMRIDSSGNVGINASDPVKTLDVRGSLAISNSASSYWYMDRNDATGNFDLNIDTNVTLFSVSTSGLGSFVNTSIGDKLLLAGDDAASARGLMFNCSTTTNQGDTWDIDAQSSTGIIKFSTGSSERMRIDSDGHILLGTDNKVGWRYSSGDISYNFITGEDQILTLTGGTWTTNATQSAVRIKTQQGEKVTVLNNGNVGIGTTSPESLLAVKGGTAVSDLFSISDNVVPTSGAEYGVMMIKTASVEYALNITAYGLTSKGLRVYNNGGLVDRTAFEVANAAGTNFVVDGLGNVGIGTTSPEEKLMVAGAITSTSSNSTGSTSGTNRAIMDLTSGGVRMGHFRGTTTAGSGYLGLYTDSLERMRITSGGNVGIGTTSPANLFSVSASSTVYTRYTSSDTGAFSLLQFENSGSIVFSADHGNTQSNSNIIFKSDGASERMRITSGGDVLIGTTTTTSVSKLQLTSSNAYYGFVDRAQVSGSGAPAGFFNSAGSVVGHISTNNTSTTYNTSSDYRLKEDLQDFNGLDKVSKIPVYDFKWKADDSRSYGVMAHELEEVVPQAVSGEKDAEEMQQVDYSKLVPILLKSIQELEARVQELEKEI